MDTALQTGLLLMVLLQIKHLFADYFLQTPRMLSRRGVYLHLGRAEHALLHAILTFLSLMIIGAPLVFSSVIALIEWGVHFHIDWLKGRHAEARQYTPADAAYWRAFGTDQLAHHLTYVAIVWLWGSFTG